MKERGEIVEIKNGTATVRVNRKSACGHCHACGMKPEDPHIDLEAPAYDGAEVGDKVEVEIPDGGVVKMSLAAYALPLATGLIPFTAVYLTSKNEILSLVSLLLGIGIGYLCVKLLDGKFFSKKRRVTILPLTETEDSQNEDEKADGSDEND